MVQAANNEVTYDFRIPIDKMVADLNRQERVIEDSVRRTVARAGKSGQIKIGISVDEAATRKRMADLIRDMRNQARNAKIEMEARVRVFGAQPSAGGATGGGNTDEASGGSLGDVFGKRSALGKTLSTLAGGGQIFALTMGLDMLGRMTGQMRQLRDEMQLTNRSAYDLVTTFGKSVPVLGSIVTLADELGQLLTGQNFGMARIAEVANVINATTQQMFQMQREAGRMMAEMDRRRQDTQGEIRVLDAPISERPRVKAKIDAEKELADFDLETKKLTGDIKKGISEMLNAPMSAENIGKVGISGSVAEQVRNKPLLELQAEASRRAADAKSRYDLANQNPQTEEDIVELGRAETKMNEANAARDMLDRAVKQVRTFEESQINTLVKGVDRNGAPTGEVSREGLREDIAKRQKAQFDEFDKIDAAQAKRMEQFTIPAAEARAAGNFDLAERLTLQGDLARKQEEADAIGKETAEQVRKENELALAAYDKRVKLAKEESKISDESRIKAAKQRQEGDLVGAEKTEREARNAAEIRAMETAGATKEEIARRIEARQAEEAAMANDRQLQSDLALARSVDEVKQAQLRASDRFYEAEMFAIEQAHKEKLRLAETSATKEVDIEIAKNERLAAITDLDAKKAKDAEASSGGRSRRQSDIGTGQWLADSIYSMSGTNPLAPVARVQRVVDGQFFGEKYNEAKYAMTKSEMEKSGVASTSTTTDADSKVEIRGDAITLLRDIARNTSNNTATFAS